MKKSVLLLAATVMATSLLSTGAFAADTTLPIAAVPATNVTATVETKETDKATVEKKYGTIEGKISEIKAEKDYTKIVLENDNMGLICNVTSPFVIDQKTNTVIGMDKLKVGMNVIAILENKAPMTMSIPPMTSGVVGFVAKSDVLTFTDLSIYNDELVNAENSLKLNIEKETVIVDAKGTKKVFTAEDIKGSECIVSYTTSTKSIPAQTTPAFVMILAEKAPEAPVEEDVKKEKAISEVPLRKTAEAAGFTVKWEANDKPVILECGDVKMSIMLGSNKVTVGTVEKTISAAVKIVDGTMICTSDLFEIK